MPGPSEVTVLLQRLGDDSGEGVREELYRLVEQRLAELARARMRGERSDHTLQPTVLVHDAFLQLVDQDAVEWRDRAHFFRTAATAMRRILVNHAKARGRDKRGGGFARVPIDEAAARQEERAPDLVALDEALDRLGAADGGKRELVELRYFAQLGVEETAEVMGLTPAAVRREWTAAKTWLLRELSKGERGE